MKACKRVFEELNLRGGPSAHPDVVMRGVCDGRGVGEVSNGIKTFVFPREGVEFGHKGGDLADHVSADSCYWGVSTST